MTHKRTKCGVEKRRVGLCGAKRRKRRKEGRELKKFSGRKREKGEKKCRESGHKLFKWLVLLAPCVCICECAICVCVCVWMLPKAGVVKPVHAILTIIRHNESV